MNPALQAYERAIDVENEFVTSEIDSSYPQSSKDIVHSVREPPQTTLYELLEYAKSRSILKNCNSNGSVSNNQGSFVIRSLNSVQFNQSQPPNENSSIKTKKKIPIRISSLKRETKTAQTLRYVVLCCCGRIFCFSVISSNCRQIWNVFLRVWSVTVEIFENRKSVSAIDLSFSSLKLCFSNLIELLKRTKYLIRFKKYIIWKKIHLINKMLFPPSN